MHSALRFFRLPLVYLVGFLGCTALALWAAAIVFEIACWFSIMLCLHRRG